MPSPPRRSAMAETTRPRWRDAAAAADRLREADRRVLRLLGRLPLLPVADLTWLCGAAGPAAVYRRLEGLGARGLAASVRPPLGPRRAPALWFLTDLGLAALALNRG